MSFGSAKERIDTLVAFNVPGNARVLTKEEIAREYGERATRPIPDGYSKRSVRSRINSGDLLRFIVYKVYETGKREFKSAHKTWEIAEREAGRRRDMMTDAECAKDYTYEAHERRTSRR